MTMKAKKKWVVRSFLPVNSGEFLEELLNELHADGYAIWEIDLKTQQVIAQLREEPQSILKVLLGDKKPDEKKEESDDPTEEEIDQLTPTSDIMKSLSLEVISILQAKSDGSPFVEERIKKVVQHVAKRHSANEIDAAIHDLARMTRLHKEHVAKHSDDGQPCNDSCHVNVVFNLFSKHFQLHKEAHLLS